MVEVIRQRLMSDFHPYMVEVYVARDGSEACISLSQSTEYCAQNGTVREARRSWCSAHLSRTKAR
jgi:hypothetical protein